MDLLGRKVFLDQGASLMVLNQTIDATITRAETLGGEAADLAVKLRGAIGQLLHATGTLAGSALENPEKAMANATVYLEAAGHIVLAWIWLEQFLAADGKTGDFYDGKRHATRYFFAWELPKTGPQLTLLTNADDTTLTMKDAWF
jgi:hypothetical protein